MAYFTTTDGVRIYYEEHGSGRPLVSREPHQQQEE